MRHGQVLVFIVVAVGQAPYSKAGAQKSVKDLSEDTGRLTDDR